jgi:hypothetical protein
VPVPGQQRPSRRRDITESSRPRTARHGKSARLRLLCIHMYSPIAGQSRLDCSGVLSRTKPVDSFSFASSVTRRKNQPQSNSRVLPKSGRPLLLSCSTESLCCSSMDQSISRRTHQTLGLFIRWVDAGIAVPGGNITPSHLGPSVGD